MSEIYMIRTTSGLVPADPAEWEKLAGDRIGLGSECKCSITVPRNIRFHRKFFAMINEAFDMQDQYRNRDHWRDVVLIAAGHCDTFITHDGKVNYKPKSISFAKCDETEFNRIYNQTIQAIVDHFLTDEAEQYKLILGYIG